MHYAPKQWRSKTKSWQHHKKLVYLFQTDVGSKSTFAKTSSFLLCSIYIGPLDLSRNSDDIKLDGKSNVHVKCKVERQHSKAYPCNTCWWTSNYNNLLYFSMPAPPNNHTKYHYDHLPSWTLTLKINSSHLLLVNFLKNKHFFNISSFYYSLLILNCCQPPRNNTSKLHTRMLFIFYLIFHYH